MKKRVLYIVWDLSRGGAQTVVYQLIKGLPAEFEPHLLYLIDDTAMLKDFEELGCVIHKPVTHLIREIAKFYRYIKELKPDIIHSHLSPGHFVLYLILRLCGNKRIYNTFHLGHFPKASMEIFTQFFITKYIQVAKITAAEHIKRYHTLPNKHLVIYNGVDTEHISKEVSLSAAGPDWPEGGIHLLGIANFHPKKGYETALPVVDKLMNRYDDLYYHICGSSIYTEEIELWIKNYISNSPNKERFILHGQVRNVFPYCAKSDIFFSATEVELMPMSMLEAMAAGLPTVYTATGGVPEVLGSQNEHGLLIPVGDSDALETALDSLISDEDRRADYAEKARRRALDFDVSNTFSKYYELYKN